MRPFYYFIAVIIAGLAVSLLPASADTATDYGKAAETWDARISPDGKHVALGCSPNGAPAVCIYALVGDSKPRLFQIADDQRLNGFYWGSDDHLIANIEYYDRMQTVDGLIGYDIGRLISYSMKTGKSRMLMGQAGNYFNLTNVNSICDVKPNKVMMELRVRANAADYRSARRAHRLDANLRTALYAVDLNTGKMKVEETANASVWTYILDKTCKPLVREIYNDIRQSYAIQMNDDKRVVYELEDVTVKPMYVVGLSPDNADLYMRVDHADMRGMYKMSLADGTLTPVKIDVVRLGNPSAIKDRYTDTIVGYSYTNDLTEQMFVDPDFKAVHDSLSAALVGQTVSITSWTRDRQMMTIASEAPGQPAAFYLYDASDQSVSPLGNLAPQFEGKTLGQVLPVQYSARDGKAIPAYLTLPVGKTKEDGPFPILLMPHGGPEARDTAAYDWWAQAYAAEGYAVLQPNFRGSSGYGASFRNAGYGEFGGKMVEDVLDGLKWAAESGYARSGGACIVGGSYGGYAALMAPLIDEGQIKCVVAVNAVTDVFSLMGEYGKGNEGYRYWERYVGANIYDSAQKKSAITPRDRTDEYDVPVLMIQATEDTTVDVNQARGFKRKWGGRDGLRYVEIKGQDHYLRTASARETVLRESIAFLAANDPAR